MGSSESEINYLSFDIISPLDITDLLTQPQGGQAISLFYPSGGGRGIVGSNIHVLLFLRY